MRNSAWPSSRRWVSATESSRSAGPTHPRMNRAMLTCSPATSRNCARSAECSCATALRSNGLKRSRTKSLAPLRAPRGISRAAARRCGAGLHGHLDAVRARAARHPRADLSSQGLLHYRPSRASRSRAQRVPSPTRDTTRYLPAGRSAQGGGNRRAQRLRHNDQRAALQRADRTRQGAVPDAVDFAQAQRWAGLRPATPGNVPVIGATSYPNLFVNAGHGTLGWTLCAGSGRAIADLVGGRRPQVDVRCR